jgi:REP element-mobilizing transposase RayT
MHSLKRYTARQANQLLGREGAFWQHENYDHVVRDEEEWQRIITYILNNPVKAGLVQNWEDWEWTYYKVAR